MDIVIRHKEYNVIKNIQKSFFTDKITFNLSTCVLRDKSHYMFIVMNDLITMYTCCILLMKNKIYKLVPKFLGNTQLFLDIFYQYYSAI